MQKTEQFQKMLDRLSHVKGLSWMLFFAAFALYLSFSNSVSIYILDEAKNAECAREMFERKDLVMPTFNGVLRTDKPPLHYFFMMLSYSIFGVNPFAARFFSALLGALTVLASFMFAKQFAGSRAALLTALVLLASVHLSIEFHLAVPDAYLVFFMTIAIYSFFILLSEQKRLFVWTLYLSLGFGALAKGPIALALPGLIFLIFLLLTRRLNLPTLRQLNVFWGSLLVVLIAAPWYLLVHLKTNGQWTQAFFLHHNLDRFSSEMEGHGGTFLATLLFVLVGLFPFSVFMPQGILHGFRNRNNQFLLLNLTGAAVIVFFFLLSQTRLPNYTIPALPFLAILIGVYLDTQRIDFLYLKPATWILAAISFMLFPGVLLGLKFVPELAPISFIGWYFLPVPLVSVVVVWLAYQRKTEHSLLGIALSGVLIALLFFGFVYPEIDRQNPVSQSIGLVRGNEVRFYGKLNSAYPFNLKREIPELQLEDIAAFLDQYPEGTIISTRDKLKNTRLPDNAEVSFSWKDTFESPVTVLLTRKEQ